MDLKKFKEIEIKEEKKFDSRGRKFKEEIIKESVHEEDDELTKLIKEELVKNKITNLMVYEICGKSQGWNMIYGLRIRHSMQWKIFKKWLTVLKKEVAIVLEDE